MSVLLGLLWRGLGTKASGAPWTLTHRGWVVFTDEKASGFRRRGVNHMVHHRAQLGPYLLLLDLLVPATYGPSRDEAPFFGSEDSA